MKRSRSFSATFADVLLLLSFPLLAGRMTSACFSKCMDTRYKDGDLNVGENSCVDRCSAKYWQVSKLLLPFVFVAIGKS